VDVGTVERELCLALRSAIDGGLWAEGRFAKTQGEFRRINDIAFSGDGEPTAFSNFDKVVAAAARVKSDLGLDDVKIVVITNSSMLDSPQVARALAILDSHNGEIWAKLDAGTEEYFRRVNRPSGAITLGRIVENITAIALDRQVVIQSLLLKFAGKGPGADEIDAYIGRLRDIIDGGGKIKLVQLHTIARSPSEESVSRLADDELDAIAEVVRAAIKPVPVETYYGQDAPPQKH